jgi:hypothetical protein
MDELEQLREFRSDVPQRDSDLSRARSALDEAIESETAGTRAAGKRGPGLWFPRRRAALIGAAVSLAVLGLAIALLPADRGGPNEAVAALQRVAVIAGDQPAQSPPGPGQYLYTRQEMLLAPKVTATDSEDRPLFFLDPFEDSRARIDKEAARAGVPKYTVQLWAGDPGGKTPGRRITDLDGVFPFPGVPIDPTASRRKWFSDQQPSMKRCLRLPGCQVGPDGRIYDPYGVRHSDLTLFIGLTPPRPEQGEVYIDLSGLPTDPYVLRKEIERQNRTDELYGETHHGGSEVETFSKVGELLSTPGNYAPPEVRQALYEVVAQLEGVELVGEGVTDPVHRAGVAVALTNNGIRRELIFDRNTAALLASRDVVADSTAFESEYPEHDLDLEPGTLISYTAYLVSGVVDSTHETLGPNPPTAEPPSVVPPGVEPPSR